MAEQTEAKLFTDGQYLIDQIETLGSTYRPPNPHSTVAAMQASLDTATAARPANEEDEAIESAKRHDRADLHKTLAPLCNDLINYCKASNWDKNDLDRLRGFRRELLGKPAKEIEDNPATTDVDESKPGASPAQTSYPSRTEHFANFVETLRAESTFAPPETPFKLTTLDATIDALRDFNTEIPSLAAATTQSRTALDAPLYTNADNFVDAANSAIAYLSSAFKNTQVYHNVKKLKFKKPKRLQS
jgi:hypothetical protein